VEAGSGTKLFTASGAGISEGRLVADE